MARPREVTDTELEKMREDKKIMSYVKLSEKYGYSVSTLKGYFSTQKVKTIPRDLIPRTFRGDIFNWDFEAF